MTAQQFQDPNTDMMEVYLFYYNIKKGKSLSLEQFRLAFSIWVFNVIGVRGLSMVQYYVIKQLNKHFGL